MNLEDIGYSPDLEIYRKEQNLYGFSIGRVISEHKERYIVKTAEQEFEAEIIGNLRFTAQNRRDFPAVGDWVAFSEFDEDKALIYAVLPRKTIIERQAVGKYAEKQIISTNVDCAFIVQAVDRDFSINRIERYLNICSTANVTPVIVLNKTDLITETELTGLISKLQERINNVPILAISNETKKGIEKIENLLEKGKTYCLLGSSGVGKSTLVNILADKQVMKTSSISESTNRGKHITSHRALIVLKKGVLIDNPGMRGVGVVDTEEGVSDAFEEIITLSENCKFKDCAHIEERGCAVLEAVKDGSLSRESYKNYLKMEKEKEHFESTMTEKKMKDKELGKLIKQYKKKRNKYKF